MPNGSGDTEPSCTGSGEIQFKLNLRFFLRTCYLQKLSLILSERVARRQRFFIDRYCVGSRPHKECRDSAGIGIPFNESSAIFSQSDESSCCWPAGVYSNSHPRSFFGKHEVGITYYFITLPDQNFFRTLLNHHSFRKRQRINREIIHFRRNRSPKCEFAFFICHECDLVNPMLLRSRKRGERSCKFYADITDSFGINFLIE